MFDFLNNDVCHRMADNVYTTDRVFFLVARFRVLFLGHRIGSYEDLCPNICTSGFGFLVDGDDERCTCGTKECDGDCLRNVMLLQKIGDLTTMKDGFFNQTWRYAPVATLGVEVPIISVAGAILWNYLGQTTPPIQLKLTPKEYGFYLDAAVHAVQQLSTDAGVRAVQDAYESYSKTLNESYVNTVGVEYPGTLWDYLQGYDGPNLNWIPHVAMLPDTLADPESPTLQDYQSAFEIPKALVLDASINSDEAEVCQTRLPPPGCRVDGSDMDVLDCLYWPKTPKVSPGDSCDLQGFFTDRGDYVCYYIRADCRGPNDKYQELYSVGGERVYCCRCTYREPGDPLEEEKECPSAWTTGDSACASLSQGQCLSIGGIWSEVRKYGADTCCKCTPPDQNPVSRFLSIWDAFKSFYDVVTSGCLSIFGPASALSTTADVLDAAGFRAVQGFMNGLAGYTCTERAYQLANVLYLDSRCTEKYADQDKIIYAACLNGVPQCGAPGFPVKTSNNKTPLTYYLRVEGSESCLKKNWNDEFSGKLTWCG